MEQEKKRQARWIEREALWQRRLEEQTGSGLSVRAYCRRESITEPSFYDWRRRLGQREAEAGSAKFARVVVSEEAEARSGGIEIQSRRGFLIRVGPGFDRAALTQVLSVIEAAER